MKNIFDSWVHPHRKPRKVQEDALNWLEKQTSRYLILQAPVGSGKSYIGLTYSRFLSEKGKGSSFILTPQKILQEQYEREFKNDHLVPFYGKANYNCKEKNSTCDIGDIIKPKCSPCEFGNCKMEAQHSPNVVLNYKLAMLSFGHTKTFQPRDLMVLDECHSLEDHLVEYSAITITEYRSKKCNVPWSPQTDITRAHSWLSGDYIKGLRARIAILEDECESLISKDFKNPTKTELIKLKELNSYTEHLDEVEEISRMKIDYLMENYILVHSPTSMQFKPIYARKNFMELINPKADRFLFMSSTIFDKKDFCDDLGLPEDDTAFLSLESEFPKENRPVYYSPVFKMNYTWNSPENSKKRDIMIKKVKDIIKNFPDDSGIIHAGNFAISKWLVEELEMIRSHVIYHHNPSEDTRIDRHEQINGFIENKKPSILISPSITEGLDLNDEKSRFCIFVKVPFLNLGDQWIKRRMEISNSWYQRKTFTAIVQGSGRVVRSKEDWGVVFILDESFGYLYNTFQNRIPKWWKDGFIR